MTKPGRTLNKKKEDAYKKPLTVKKEEVKKAINSQRRNTSIYRDDSNEKIAPTPNIKTKLKQEMKRSRQNTQENMNGGMSHSNTFQNSASPDVSKPPMSTNNLKNKNK